MTEIFAQKIHSHSKTTPNSRFFAEDNFSISSFFSFKWSQLYFEFELWSHCISIGISFKRFQKKPRVKWAIWTWLFNFLKRKITPDWRSKPVILRSWISIELKSGKKYNETAKIPDVHRKWSNLTLFNKLWTIWYGPYQSPKLLNFAKNCKSFVF